MVKRKKKKKVRLKKGVKLLLFVLAFVVIYFYILNQSSGKKIDIAKYYKNLKTKTADTITQIKYDECIGKGITDEQFNEETKNKRVELVNYIKNNGIKYYYSDLTYNYEIKYNPNEAVYGASLIKLVGALYLIDNDIDLTQTVKYEARHKMAYSTGMEKHKIGDEVPLSELMEYTMTYSDNTAHNMIMEFIGKQKLKEYGKSLGAQVTLDGHDNFGNQTASDMIIYLRKALELFEKNEAGRNLKQYMFNHDKNALNFDDVEFAHKYGSHSTYFHDAGIYFGTNPYLIVVLTLKGEERGPSYVTKTSRLTYDFHKAYGENLKTYCLEESKK